MNITVVGSINIDLVYRVPHIVREGETLHSTSHSIHFGGKGSNQAVTAGQLGANVRFIGKVGADAFGEQAIENMESKNVRTDLVGRQGSTGQAIIQVSDSGENSIVLFPGANFLVTPNQVEQEMDVLRTSDALLLQLEIPLESVTKAAGIAARAGKTVILNPAPARELPDELLRNVTILTPNETELKQLTGIDPVDEVELRKACDVMLAKGVGAVVVTLGSKGAFYQDETEFGWIDAVEVEPVDTTGAGDAFNGALAVALCRGDSISEAVKYANQVAGFVVTKMGAQPELKAGF
ncbi:ribokinase [Chungangia koreensis]|uniref:Ribokinase n=1 Tax=Chungangia koreensis TaxID=752657 RepID=A0ABV8X685_9LACT